MESAAEATTNPRRRLSAGTERWLLWNCPPTAPAENMATDEALLERATSLGSPVLRFYSWTIPAATFGYFQHYAELERVTPLRPLIRRTTGGGLVPHDADWTVSLTIPPSHPWYQLSAVASYQRFHQWVADAFGERGVAAELSPGCRKEVPGQCFVGAEKFDVLWHGRKIAGAAQRRNRLGLLIQGSIQPPSVKMTRAEWEQAFCAVAARQWDVVWLRFEPDGALREQVQRLAREKYGCDKYNRRR